MVSTDIGVYIAIMNERATHTAKNASDIPAYTWIDRFAPELSRPFFRLARLDRPIGVWLLLIPCWWGLALAEPNVLDWQVIGLFALGAVVMRGAGCTVNDLVDRDIDAKVARTAARPIASGQISVAHGVTFLGVQVVIGAWVLLQFNQFAIQLGVTSLGLVFVYPFLKRITYWPQLWLGLTFNWGVLMGWTVVEGSLGMAPSLLYMAGIFWTLGYDTIYAHQDKQDDLFAGVKSSALALGEHTKPWLCLFYAAALTLIGAAGLAAQLTWPFFIGLGFGTLHMINQVWRVDINHPAGCLVVFKSNRDFGFVILAGILSARFVPA